MISRVEIDEGGGFCGGVIRAIGSAEDFLRAHPGRTLYSLGPVVHNESELERLAGLGLVTLDSSDIPSTAASERRPIIIRAHGESPAMYGVLRESGFEIIDCTCPVVLGIQKKIASAPGDVLIYGKKGHPEVTGLVGNAKGRVWVVENMDEARELLAAADGPSAGADIFSQTTMSPVGYDEVCALLASGIPDLRVHRTICSQVERRHANLEKFALGHDVIVFVTGKSSSNGRVLSDLCRSVNPRTYVVGGVSDIDPAWFRPGDSVGVSGATSTPRWLLENVADCVRSLSL